MLTIETIRHPFGMNIPKLFQRAIHRFILQCDPIAQMRNISATANPAELSSDSPQLDGCSPRWADAPALRQVAGWLHVAFPVRNLYTYNVPNAFEILTTPFRHPHHPRSASSSGLVADTAQSFFRQNVRPPSFGLASFVPLYPAGHQSEIWAAQLLGRYRWDSNLAPHWPPRDRTLCGPHAHHRSPRRTIVDWVTKPIAWHQIFTHIYHVMRRYL